MWVRADSPFQLAHGLSALVGSWSLFSTAVPLKSSVVAILESYKYGDRGLASAETAVCSRFSFHMRRGGVNVYRSWQPARMPTFFVAGLLETNDRPTHRVC